MLVTWTVFTFPVPPFTTVKPKRRPKLRQVRRAAEQELFDLANRARSAEVMTVMGRGDGGNTPFFLTKKEVLVGKCLAFLREKHDGDVFF